jgi:N-methylhydantoinase A
MDKLINIDNGGTLTDICVWDGRDFSFTKTLTTPFDLSQCLFDGITKASAEVYGETDLPRLLHDTRHIRYSTTQGTNALVERKGPDLGLITDDPFVIEELLATTSEAELFKTLVGGRVAVVDPDADPEQLEFDLVQQVNRLTTDGAARIVVAVGATGNETEQRLRNILLRKFPRHLLGSVPFLYSWDFADDRRRTRRIWSSLVNSFLHPVMERFLYNAEERLREHKVQNPLLIYRNDGASSRVSKSVALKTYSSGPRGGLEGTRALAEAYGLKQVLMIDVGGTTTDVGSVREAEISTVRRGAVVGVPISFPMSEVHSSGVGGSSVIQVRDGRIHVGPESVGAAPGPACFGFGGTQATITDVNLLLGVLDGDTYLDGGFSLDAERSRAVITATVAEPLGISLDGALIAMEEAYFGRMAEVFADLIVDPATTTVAAFGGAGPMSACGAAQINGVHQILVPRLAAVFSAFGIGFSDIGRSYETSMTVADPDAVEDVRAALTARAGRDMFQEGYELDECELSWGLDVEDASGELVGTQSYDGGPLPTLMSGETLIVRLDAKARLPHASLTIHTDLLPSEAVAAGTRAVLSGSGRVEEVKVYDLSEQQPGARAWGPAIVEGPFFTARVLEGWSFEISSAGDLLLNDDEVTLRGGERSD